MKKVVFFSKIDVFKLPLLVILVAVLQTISFTSFAQGDEPWTAFTADPITGCVDVTVDPALYTPSANPGAPGCANNPSWQGVQQADVWFALVVPSSGVLLLNPQGTVDAGMAAYTLDGSTGLYTLLACDDDTGPGLMPQINVTTVPAGEIVYVQLWAYAGGLINFSLCSSDCEAPTAYYSDADGDGFGNNSNAIYTCTPDPSLITDNTDCNDADATINTAAVEICYDLIDNNCDTQIDEGCIVDADGDGFTSDVDCNDGDPNINPSAAELCDLIDNNCNTILDEGFDQDGDGFTSCNGDCDDSNPSVFIGASCDDGNPNSSSDVIQADCSCAGAIGDDPSSAFTADPTTGCLDITVDPTTYTISTVVAAPGCAGNSVGSENPDVWVLLNVPSNGELLLSPQGTGDAGMAAYSYDAGTNTYTLLGCNDDSGPGLMPLLSLTGLIPGSPIYIQLWAYNPGNTLNFYFCSSDCTTALAYFMDADADGFGDNSQAPVLTCTPDANMVLDGTDCNDASSTSYPGATEFCDGLDNDCNGLNDDNCVGLVDNDGDGFTSDVDCDDSNISINPAAIEVCDGIDNNCNIEIDEFVSTEYYADLDGDGFGDVNNTVFDCSQPAGYVTNFDDCDDANITYVDGDGDGDGSTVIDACGSTTNGDCADNNPAVSSLAIEICENGIDDDCTGGDALCAGVDLDADGFNAPADCNDNDASINPGAVEVCGDAIDQNCSGVADEGCVASDNDGDGFDALTDCNDNCATIYPGAPCNDANASTVGETIQADCSCGGGTTVVSCLGPQSISFEPAPTGGTWPVGTNVTICYRLWSKFRRLVRRNGNFPRNRLVFSYPSYCTFGM
jgi:hypothetical protein